MEAGGEARAYAFFFNADYGAFEFTYGDSIDKVFFSEVLAADTSGLEAFRIWEGDLAVHRLAERLISVRTHVPTGKYLSHQRTTQVDTRLWTALVWDLCDSAVSGWHSFDPREAARTFLRHNVHVVSVSDLGSRTRAQIDTQLAVKPFYLGAMEIDLGNPLQWRVLVQSLSWTNAYRERSLLFIDDWFGDDERYDLDGSGHWWSKLPFTNVDWESVDSSRLPEPLQGAQLSPRGAKSRDLLLARAQPGHLERVAEELYESIRAEESVGKVELDISTIPDAPAAVIPPPKLRDYALNPEHPVGGEKAALFEELLELRRDDWRFLGYQILVALPDAPVVAKVRLGTYGIQYHVDLAAIGRNGNVKPVRTAWIIRETDPPQLLTAYVAPSNTSLQALPAPVQPPFIGKEPISSDDFTEMVRLAVAAGDEAASRVAPTPMFIAGSVVPEGEFGGAWINVPDARRRFPRWALRSGVAYPGNGSGISIPAGRHPHVQKAEAYARAFQLVLWLHGIDSTVDAYLD